MFTRSPLKRHKICSITTTVVNILNPAASRLFSLWFLVTAGLAAIGGTIWLVYTMWFVAHAAKAQGHIVAMRSSAGPHGSTEYAPVFAFNDASGITHTQLCSVSSSGYSYEVGEKVPVLYDPARPVHSNIDSFTAIWLFPLLVVGVSLFTGSLLVVWYIAFNSIVKREQSRVPSW